MLAALAGVFICWLICRIHYRSITAGLKARLLEADQEIKHLRQEHLDITNAYAAARERVAMQEDLRRQMADTFGALSSHALQNNNQTFLDLARTALSEKIELAKHDMDDRGKSVDRMIHPLREALNQYDRHISAMEQKRQHAYGGLVSQIQSLVESQQDLRKETGKLSRALQVPHVRGRWGEITLRRVAELSGMQNRCDFFEQPTVSGNESRMRPDMVVHLPGNRNIVIDAKVPLTAYLDALETEIDSERDNLLSAHAKQVQSHVQQLAQKSYWKQLQPTPEFVVLFIPGENFFSAALSKMPTLIEDGAAKGVILATPTTLISLLKTVSYGWNQVTAAENAKAIGELGRELYERLSRMVKHLNKLGQDLARSTKSFNQVVGSYERRVLSSARKFEECGISIEGERDPLSVKPVEEHPLRTVTDTNGEPLSESNKKTVA